MIQLESQIAFYIQKSFFLLFFLGFQLTSLHVQAQDILISGSVINKISEKPLAFATVAIPGSAFGTMTNSEGQFELFLKAQPEKIQISFIGYRDTIVHLSKDLSPLKIELIPYEYILEEVIVRSLSPRNYIIKAIENHPALIPAQPFETQSYYAEKTSILNDNTKANKMKEAVFSTYYHNYSIDDISSENRLQLYRENNQGVFSSMLEENKKLTKRVNKRYKKDNKKIAKGKKENNAVNKDESNFDNVLSLTEGGPKQMLFEAQRILKRPFLDMKQMDKFEYKFGKQTIYKGNELLPIEFYSIKKVDNSIFKGTIYLDYHSLAIISLVYYEEAKIPFFINPIVKLYLGIGIQGINRNVTIRNQQYEGLWYPKEILLDTELVLTQKKKIETIITKELLSVDNIDTRTPETIDEALQFFTDKEFEAQIHNLEGLEWSKVNSVSF